MTGRMLDTREDKLAALRAARVIAVVGLQDNPARPAYGVARFLKTRGLRIIPVHPAGGTVLGEPVVRSLAELPVRADVVDVFRNPAHALEVVEEVLRLPETLRPSVIWLQDGVINPEAAQRAVSAGYAVVMDDCTARVSSALPPVA